MKTLKLSLITLIFITIASNINSQGEAAVVGAIVEQTAQQEASATALKAQLTATNANIEAQTAVQKAIEAAEKFKNEYAGYVDDAQFYYQLATLLKSADCIQKNLSFSLKCNGNISKGCFVTFNVGQAIMLYTTAVKNITGVVKLGKMDQGTRSLLQTKTLNDIQSSITQMHQISNQINQMCNLNNYYNRSLRDKKSLLRVNKY